VVAPTWRSILLNYILFKSSNSREAFRITTLNDLLDSTIPIIRLSKFLVKFRSALKAPYIAVTG
jgi:hypothetical protein